METYYYCPLTIAYFHACRRVYVFRDSKRTRSMYRKISIAVAAPVQQTLHESEISTCDWPRSIVYNGYRGFKPAFHFSKEHPQAFQHVS